MKSVLTPLDFLERSAWVYRGRTAVVDGARRFTYSEFHERVHRQASALRKLGIAPGDRVAVLAPNTVAALEAQFGVILAGAVLVMINTRLQAAELAWILNHCEARAAIADPQLAPLLESVRGELPHLAHLISDYEGLLAQGESPFTAAGEPDEDGLICGQLHQRDHRLSERRHVHAPRRVSECAGRSAGAWPDLPFRLPVDAAAVSLQRLVLPLGRHGGRRAARLHAAGRSGKDRGADPRRRCDASVRGAGGGRHTGAILRRPGHTVRRRLAHCHGRRAAFPGGDTRGRGDGREPGPRLRFDGDLRAAYHLRMASGVGRASGRRARPDESAAGRALHRGRRRSAGGRPTDARCSAGWPKHGRGGHARQQRDARAITGIREPPRRPFAAAGSIPATWR